MTESWLRDVPAVFRALADPKLSPTVPRPSTGPLEHACAHWGALDYTLSNLLGWSDPGRGLAWWYAAGKPVDASPVLYLVREVWGVDDLLDYYAAWSWLPNGAGYLCSQAEDPLSGPSPTWLAQHSRWQDEEWWRAFVRRGRVHHHDPFYGGTDPLHLAAHRAEARSVPSAKSIVHPSPGNREVVLITGGLEHWLADLGQLHAQLPPVGDRSWRVEVFDRQVGFLGRFRKSRITGRWFTGKHWVHMRGNAEPKSA